MARTRATDFESKQRTILSRAAMVFATTGMEKASMAQIAAECNISKALLYHYYPSKNALIFDIILTHLSELDEAIKAADKADVPPEKRLRGLVLKVLQHYRDAEHKHKVLLYSMNAIPPDQMEQLRAVERRIVKRFSSIIREINPKLDSRKRPLLMPVTMSLFGILNWVYTWFRPSGPISREDYAGIATTLMLDGIKAVR